MNEATDDNDPEGVQPNPEKYTCPSETVSVLERLYSEFLSEDLVGAWNQASKIDFGLRECTSFSLIAGEVLDELRSRSKEMELDRFWGQTSQLLILITRSYCRVIQRLIEGASDAIRGENELSLAFVSRALIEHCGALLWFRTNVLADCHARLNDDVWPAEKMGQPLPDPTESDRRVQENLIRFALGARANLEGAQRPSDECGRTRWEKYRKKIESLPDEISAKGVMDYVDELVRHEGYRDLRVNHAILSEYCHPNSASRTFDFVASSRRHLSRRIVEVAGADFTPGFIEVFDVFRNIMVRVCDRFSQDLEVASTACIPMSGQPMQCEDFVPPPGWVRVTDLFTGRTSWVDPIEIGLPKKPAAQLKADQEERAIKLASILASPAGVSEHDWILRLRRNSDVESELQISEHMAQVFVGEMRQRPNASPSEGNLVYLAIERGLYCKSTEELVSILPSIKSLGNVDRLFSALKKWRRDGIEDREL
jgi:hypothetical protein